MSIRVVTVTVTVSLASCAADDAGAQNSTGIIAAISNDDRTTTMNRILFSFILSWSYGTRYGTYMGPPRRENRYGTVQYSTVVEQPNVFFL